MQQHEHRLRDVLGEVRIFHATICNAEDPADVPTNEVGEGIGPKAYPIPKQQKIQVLLQDCPCCRMRWRRTRS